MDMDNPDSLLPFAEAAAQLGISREALRKRITRGRVTALRRGGQWFVNLNHNGHEPDTLDVSDSPDSVRTRSRPSVLSGSGGAAEIRRLEELVASQRDELSFLREQLQGEQEARRREVSELHILLQRAQAPVPLPAGADHEDENQPTPVEPAQERRRRWWWPW
jgi:hypothetical protein